LGVRGKKSLSHMGRYRSGVRGGERKKGQDAGFSYNIPLHGSLLPSTLRPTKEKKGNYKVEKTNWASGGGKRTSTKK